VGEIVQVLVAAGQRATLCVDVEPPGVAEVALYAYDRAECVAVEAGYAPAALDVTPENVNRDAAAGRGLPLSREVRGRADGRLLLRREERVVARNEGHYPERAARRDLSIRGIAGKHDLRIGAEVRIDVVVQESARRPALVRPLVEVQRAEVVGIGRGAEPPELSARPVDGIAEQQRSRVREGEEAAAGRGRGASARQRVGHGAARVQTARRVVVL